MKTHIYCNAVYRIDTSDLWRSDFVESYELRNDNIY